MTGTVRFPMSYRIHGTLHGRVLPRSYIFAEMVDVSITEVSPSDAPLAVSWKVLKHGQEFMGAEYEPMWNSDHDERQHTVFYNGRHWVRMLEGLEGYERGKFGLNDPMRTSDFVGGVETGIYNRSLGFTIPTQGQRGFEFVQDDPVSRFASIERHGRLAAARKASSLEFISVEGVLHMRCDQPVLKMAPVQNRPPKRTIVHYPMIDVIENRSTRSFGDDRISIVPLSMYEEFLKRSANSVVSSHLATLFEPPTVHLPESISDDENLRLEADYLVQEFLAQTRAILGTQYAYVERYFTKRLVEEKLEYLMASEKEWAEFTSRYGISTDPLRRAVEALEGMSISLTGDFLPKGTPAPK